MEIFPEMRMLAWRGSGQPERFAVKENHTVRRHVRGLCMRGMNRDFEHLARAVIRDEIRRTIASGGSFRTLADRAGLAETTVESLAYGGTSCPQLKTVLALLEILGFAVRIERAPSSPEFAVYQRRL